MLIDGRVLTEVAGILFYLAKRFPAAGLLPDGDIEAEGRVVSWIVVIASSIHPARRQGLEHARAIYALADKRLGGTSGPGRSLLDRRHPSVPALLALPQFARSRARRVFPTSRRTTRA